MKKILKLFIIVAIFLLGSKTVFADSCTAKAYLRIYTDTSTYYQYDVSSGEEISDNGISYDSETNTLTLNNVDAGDFLVLDYNSFDIELTINLIGDNSVDRLLILNTNATITGDGNLVVNGDSTVGPNECGAGTGKITFDMEGIVTLNGYLVAENSEEDGIVLGDNVTLSPGYNVYNYNSKYYYLYTKAITTDLYNTLSDTTTVIYGNKYTISDDTTKTSFTSDTELDEDYHLEVEDKTTTVLQSVLTKLQGLEDNSTLLFLYGINVLDSYNEKVSMENGKYVIRFYLKSDIQENYSSLIGVYVTSDGEIGETFDVKSEGDYVYITTTHLSDYAILGVEEEYMIGDLNNNGKIDLVDILMLIKLKFNKIEANSYYYAVGDIDGNGSFDLTDILSVIKLYFGKA